MLFLGFWGVQVENNSHRVIIGSRAENIVVDEEEKKNNLVAIDFGQKAVLGCSCGEHFLGDHRYCLTNTRVNRLSGQNERSFLYIIYFYLQQLGCHGCRRAEERLP